MKTFNEFINENKKLFVKHFRPAEYDHEIEKLSEWKNTIGHFYTTNDVGDHLEVVLYVHGNPTEKFIFDKKL